MQVADPFQPRQNRYVLATSYFWEQDDTANRLELLPHQVDISVRGELSQFLLADLKSVRLVYRRWVGMITGGGLLSSLSLLAILSGYKPFFLLFFLLLAGLLLINLGVQGNWSMAIELAGGTRYYEVPRKHEHMEAFVQLVNRRRADLLQQRGPVILHVVSKSDWEAQAAAQQYVHASLSQEGFIHAAEPEQLSGVLERFFSGQQELLLLQINPQYLTVPLRWELAPDVSDYFPHIFGPIDKAAIQSVVPVTAPAAA